MRGKIIVIVVFVFGIALGAIGNSIRNNWGTELNRKFSSDTLSVNYTINTDDSSVKKSADDSLNICFHIVSANLQLNGEAGRVLTEFTNHALARLAQDLLTILDIGKNINKTPGDTKTNI